MQRPDPTLTPGEAGPARVARHVSLALKHQVYASYGIGLLQRLGYVIDHLIPLELNGTNGPRNLWPQPRAEAKLKDRDETRLALEVAAGTLSLQAAQQKMLADWGAAGSAGEQAKAEPSLVIYRDGSYRPWWFWRRGGEELSHGPYWARWLARLSAWVHR